MLKKKWLKTMLMALIATPIILGVGAESANAWGGSGTETDPYKISTPQDLNTAFNTSSTYCIGNKYFELTADIDVDSVYANWQPGCKNIGGYFNGFLEGNGYTIKDMKVINQGQLSGLFNDIYKSSAAFPTTVQNVNFSGASIDTNGDFNGILSGRIRGRTYNDNVVIKNIHLRGALYIDNGGYQYHGGLAGAISYTDLINIVSDANVSATFNAGIAVQYFGGIAGTFEYGDATNIYNHGNVYVFNNDGNAGYSNYYVGGIFGSMNGSASHVNELKNIRATGYVHNESYYGNTVYTAGLFGYVNGLVNMENLDADNEYVRGHGYSYNTGENQTSGNNRSQYTGGVAGFVQTGNNSTSYQMKEVVAKTPVTINIHSSNSYQYMPTGIAATLNIQTYDTYAINTSLYQLSAYSGWNSYSQALSGNAGYTNGRMYHWNDMGRSGNLLTSYSNGGKSKTQLQTKSTYTNFDFNNVWYINEGYEYPYLKTEPVFTNPLSPANKQSINQPTINLQWKNLNVDKNRQKYGYQLVLEDNSSGSWVVKNTQIITDVTQTSYEMAVPLGTSAGTDFRWKIVSLGKKTETTSFVLNESSYRYFVYTNNQTAITTTFQADNNMNLSSNKRYYDFSINTIKDPDTYNYSILYVDVLNSVGSVIAGSKQKIVLDSDLTNNASYLIKDGTAKDGALQGAFDHKTPINLKLRLEPDLTNRKFSLSVVKTDSLTEVVTTKLINSRSMQLKTDGTAEKFTLRVYAEDYQNGVLPSSGAMSQSLIAVKQINIDTRNYIPVMKNVIDDVNERNLSENEGFNKITISGGVEDKDITDNVKVYYEIQPESELYSILAPGGVPTKGVKVKDYTPGALGVDGTFDFTYLVEPILTTGDYALLLYGIDNQGGISDPHVIPFRVESQSDGPFIHFTADYTQADSDVITMSTAERQIVAEDSKIKLYFTPTYYSTFDYAGYLIRGTDVYDLSIRGAFTSDVSSTFVGIDLGKATSLIGGTTMDFQLNDRILLKFKAKNATGGIVEKDVRILIGNDSSTFEPISDINMPTF